MFPNLNFDDVPGRRRMGRRPDPLEQPVHGQRHAVQTVGSHSLKIGADLRKLGVTLATET